MIGFRIGMLAAAASLLIGCTPTRPPERGIFPPVVDAEDLPRAVGLDPTVDISGWTFGGRTGRVITTPNFRIHTTLGDSPLRRRLPGFAEVALANYQRSLGARLAPPDGPLQTYVMATRPQWEELTNRVAGLNAPTYLRIQRGGYAADGRGVYWDIGPKDTLMVAGHEGWHQYTQATFAQPLPLWLEEGVGAYMEGFGWHPTERDLPVFRPWANTERYDRLRRAYTRGELMTLRTLLNSRPQDLIAVGESDALTFYAQVWALVHFLRERDPAALGGMLADAQAGRLGAVIAETAGERAASVAIRQRVGDAAYRAYFGDDLDAAARAYERFIAEIVRPGGRDLIVSGRSPIR